MLGNNRNTSIKNFNFSLTLPSDLQLVPETEFYAVWGFAGSKNRLKLEKKGNKILNAEALSLAPHEAVTIAVKFPENYVLVEEFKEVVEDTNQWEIPYREKKRTFLLEIIRGVLIFDLGQFVLFFIPFTSSRFIKGIKRIYAFMTNKSERVKDIIYYTPPK